MLGFTIAVLKVPDVFEETVQSLEATHHAYRISKTSPGQDTYQVILASDDLPEPTEAQVFTYGGCKWKLEVAPAWGWRMPPPLAITLSVGLILVFLVTFLTHALLHLQDRRRYLRQLADTDALTGLNNRQGFDTAVDAYLDKFPKIGAIGVMIDIDDFKRINDLYSHDTGDEALRSLANDLREAFPAPAIVGRNGGDEFVVFMKDAEPEAAQAAVKAFSNKKKAFTYDGETHSFSVSIGYTLYRGDGMSLSRLFHQSDTALYAVKLRGRNHYRIYEPSMESLNRTSLGFNLETITKNLPMALLVTEAKKDGKILFVNKAMLDLLECQNVTEFMAFTEENQSHIVCACERERVRQLMEQQLLEDADKTYSVTYCIRTAKGRRKHIFSVWCMADNPNYGRVFYATLVEQKFLWPFISEHPSEDDNLV